MTIPSTLRYALRSLQTSWGFTAIFVFTLALGLVGVSTMFSIVNTVILRPLPFQNPDRIVTLAQSAPFLGNGPQVCTLAEFLAWQKSNLLDYEAAVGTKNLTLTGKDRAALLYGAEVTPDFFSVFGIRPLLGRAFVQQDATPGHDQLIMLSHELWASRFASDPAIVGKRIRFTDATMTVIGVMPPRFDFPRLADVGALMRWAPEQTQFWVPLTITPKLVEQNNYNYYVVGRLRAGVQAERAAAEFRTLAIQTYRDFASRNPEFRDQIEQAVKALAIPVTPLAQSMASRVRDALWMLLAAVGLLLLLVLFNLGNLLVTRHANRIPEYAVRQALGASAWQLFRQALVEQGILVGISCLLSFYLSSWAIDLIRSVAAGRLPRLYELSFDTNTAALLLGLTLATAIVFGGLPLLLLPGSAVHFSLAAESRSATGDRRTESLRAGLIAAEIALSMVLLVSAGLLTASFANVLKVKPGFDPKNLLTFTISFDPKSSSDPANALAARRELLDRIRTLPGAQSATVVNVLPLTGDFELHGVRAVGRPFIENASRAEYRVVDSGYFASMRIPLIAGRTFRDDDSDKFVVVNRKMAERLWRGESAIGRQFSDGDNPPLTVIGVVENVHGGTLELEPMMQFYSPLSVHPTWASSFAIRTKVEPLSLLPAVEKTVSRLDPDEAISGAGTMQDIVESITLERRLETELLAGFSASALFLSALGLFGVASLSVTRHAREFGIRMALGATGVDVLGLEVTRNGVVVIAGLAVGLALSVGTHRAIAGLLFGVSPLNAGVYGTAALVLTGSAIVAVLIPALRAARMDPAIALRNE